LKVEKVAGVADCFNIKDLRDYKDYTGCAMEQDSRSHEELVKDWMKQIQFFQEKCYKQLPTAGLDKANPVIEMR